MKDIDTAILSKALALAFHLPCGPSILDVLPYNAIDLPVEAPPIQVRIFDCCLIIPGEPPLFTAPPPIPDIRDRLLREWKPLIDEAPAEIEDEQIENAITPGSYQNADITIGPEGRITPL